MKKYTLDGIMTILKRDSDPKSVGHMIRYGINPDKALGVRIPVLRGLAKKIGINHPLALELWDSGIHEARILASMIADIKQMDQIKAEGWIGEFNSWDLCDQCIMNLFEKLPNPYQLAVKWAKMEGEWYRRAGFVMMARLAVSDKKAMDQKFDSFYPLIKKYAPDDRNWVKKAVNWALRQIGKRNLTLNKKCIQLGEEILRLDSKSARWVAYDALRELKSEAIQRRLKKKSKQ